MPVAQHRRRRRLIEDRPADKPGPAPRERIVGAALAGFAENGVKATTIRRVAATAGVSPGLVQHYFPSKEALRSAVDCHVTEIARRALAVRSVEGDVIEDLAERLTALVADNFTALRYVGRGVAEDDEAALTVFNAILDLCRPQLEALQTAGMLRPDLDLAWAALHTVIVNLGTVMLEPGISRFLDRSFLEPDQVKRWKDATTKLFVEGEVRSQPSGGRRSEHPAKATSRGRSRA